MMSTPRTILQVNAADMGGGAESIAWCLHQGYLRAGHQAYLAVGRKTRDEDRVLAMPRREGADPWHRGWAALYRALSGTKMRFRGHWRLTQLARALASPGYSVERHGEEFFYASGTQGLLELPPATPDVLHLHCLHGGYFDITRLPELTHRVPTVMTLHDEWIYTGHCGWPVDCGRWERGCGPCPYLDRYPPIQRDGSAFNWQRKRDLLRQSRIFLASPSQWLLDRAMRSVLAPAVAESRVIRNGVDTDVFHPADRMAARAALGLPAKAHILLFTAFQVRRNAWKDYRTIEQAVGRVAAMLPGEDVILIALGEDAPSERIGTATVHFVPFQADTRRVASYYQAADLYLHAALVENFPTVILEALSCGTPVVATALGGIPEQVEDGRNGYLVPPGDHEAMAARVAELLRAPAARQAMGDYAAAGAQTLYSQAHMVETYLQWYEEICADHAASCRHG